MSKLIEFLSFNSIKSVIQYYLIVGLILLNQSATAERTIFYHQKPSPPMPWFNPEMHLGDVYGCAFVDGGETLVTVGKDRTIRLWDARTLEHKRVVYGNTQLTKPRIDQGTYYCVASHPTRNIIAVAGRLGLSFSGVRVVDLDRDIQLDQENQGEKIVDNVSFSADGRWLIAGTYSGDINLWEIFPDDLSKDAMRFCHMFHTGETIKLLRFPDAGDYFIYQTSSDNTYRARINPETKQIESSNRFSIRGFANISPDGKTVLGHNRSDNLTLFNSATGNPEMVFSRQLDEGYIPNATFSRDGKKIYYPKDDSMWVAERERNIGQSLFRLCDTQRDIRTGSNGLVALVGSSPGSIYVLDSKTNQLLVSKEVPPSIKGIGWGIDEPYKIAWGLGNSNSSSPLKHGFDLEKMEPFAVGLRDDGFRKNLRSWNNTTVSRRGWRELMVDSSLVHNSKSSILDYSFTKNGRLVYTSWWHNGMVKKDASASFLPDPFFGVSLPSGSVWSVVGSQDLPVFASAGEDGVIQIWHEDKGTLLVNLYVDKQGEWVCWTPLGYYDASENGHHYLDWVTDHGIDSLSREFFEDSAREVFYRPDVVKKVIQTQTYVEIVADQMGLGIGELEGGVRVNRLPFKLTGKGLPERK